MSTIAERVAAGAAWLDQKRPGWHNEINLSELLLSSPCRCVLGQLYGDFDRVAVRGPMAKGFNAYGRHSVAAEFADLETEWRRVITERRAAA